MTDKYILDTCGNPVPEPDLLKWGRWFEDSRTQRIVKQEYVKGVKVSTVFLGLNHRWGKGPPILWETMIFGGPLDQEQDRCSGSREQAKAMHTRMVNRLKEELEKARCDSPRLRKARRV